MIIPITRNQNNRFTVARLHYSLDPDKAKPEWKERTKRGMPEAGWMKEYEIDYSTYSGKAVFAGDFKHELHVRLLEKPSREILYVGWDFGYHRPAVVITKINQFDQWEWLKGILGKDEGIEKFGERVKNILLTEYAGCKFLHACFVPGTLITTEDGFKPIQEIGIGERVLTHRGRWKRVVKTFERVVGENLYQVKPTGGLALPLVCTGNHKVWSVIRGAKEYGNKYIHPEFNQAQELDKNCQVFGANNMELFKPVAFSPLELKIFGAFMGDGYAYRDGGKNNAVYFYFGKDGKKKELVSLVKDFCRLKNIRLHLSDEGNMVRLSFHDKNLCSWFRGNFYNGKGEKVIPRYLLMTPYGQLSHILEGLYLTDGWKEKARDKRSKLVGISNTSYLLLRDIYLRLQLEGISVSFYLKRSARTGKINGRSVNQKNYYQLMMYGSESFYSPHYNNSSFNYSVRTLNSCKKDKVVYYGKVYNLEVEDDHSYVANGIVVSNCDPAGHQKTDKAEKTSIQVLEEMDIFPQSRPSAIVEGVEIIRQKLAMRDDGKVGLLVNETEEDLIEGFKGGYRYPEYKEGQPEKEEPLKDGYYIHLFDSFRYIAVNFFSLVDYGKQEGNPITKDDPNPRGDPNRNVIPEGGGMADLF